RYRSHILDVKIGPESRTHPSLSIADLLEATVEEAISFLNTFPDSRPARRAVQSLSLLEEVGLGYLKLGQPINTLSGGESQRLKLVRHLAEVARMLPDPDAIQSSDRFGERDGPISNVRLQKPRAGSDSTSPKPLLFLFDEPTTGLHFEDVGILLCVFQRLVDAG